MLNKLESVYTKIKDEKIKNTIKSEILNGISFIKKFINSSPGVISPAKVAEEIKSIRGYLKVWIRNVILVEEVEDIFSEIETRYINLGLDSPKSDKIEGRDNSILSKKPIKDSIIPWHTKKLFNDVELKKQDISYLPIGPCNHYCMVYKIVGDKTYVIPFTTDVENFEGYLIEKSRFFKGKAIYSLYQFPTTMVKDRFVLPYDHKGEGNSIVRSLESFIISILPKKRSKVKTP